MTNRERSLAVILSAFLGLLFAGFVFYQFIYDPYSRSKDQIEKLSAEIDKKQDDLLKIQKAKKDFEIKKQQSLPGDVKISRGQYSRLLEALLQRSGFPANSLKIAVAEPDAKTAPVIKDKKTAYTRLSYEVNAKGELFYFVEFLKHFYEQPLLHMVKKINMQRPSDAKSQAKGELDVTMTIEAIVLDNAPDRGILFTPAREAVIAAGGLGATGLSVRAFESGKGSPLTLKNALADPPREYQSISTKNIFFGPAPVAPAKPEFVKRETPAEDDISQFITLTSIVGHPEEGLIVAVFRDKLNNHDYTVTQLSTGRITVDATYDLPSGRRKTLYPAGSPEIIYGSAEGKNLRVFRVRRVFASELVVEEIFEEKPVEKPTFPLLMAGGFWSAINLVDKPCSVIAVGQNFDGLSPLTSREAFKTIYAKPVVVASNDDDKGR